MRSRRAEEKVRQLIEQREQAVKEAVSETST
jgi:hypothetical protein